jgi:hypothetical protein
MLHHNRQLTISAAGSRKATHWPAQAIWWSELPPYKRDLLTDIPIIEMT